MTPDERAAAMVRLLTPFGINYGARLHAAAIAAEARHDFVVIVGPIVYGVSTAEIDAALAIEVAATPHGTVVVVPLDDASLQVP